MVTYYGNIDENGDKQSGSEGWHPELCKDEGCYKINFEKKGDLSVVATQIARRGSALDNVIIDSYVEPDSGFGCAVILKTGDSKGKGTWRPFSFIAMVDPSA